MNRYRDNTTHLFTAVALANALVFSTAACSVALDDVAPEDVESTSPALTYNVETKRFEEHIRRQVSRGNDKHFLFRVKQNSTVSVEITKENAYNTQFKLVFMSEEGVLPLWDDGGEACTGSTGTSHPNVCSAPATGAYADIIARAVNDNNAGDFTLDYDFEGPCDAQSCYASTDIRVNKLTNQKVKKPSIDPNDNTQQPGLMAGHSATLTIERSHLNITIVNGAKFKAVDDNAELNDIVCGAWDGYFQTCSVVASEDGRIHIPFKVTNTKTKDRWAKVVIVRDGEYITDQTDSVINN